VAGVYAATRVPEERPYAWPDGGAASLTVKVREDVVGTKATRRLDVVARGTLEAGRLDLQITHATLTGSGPDGRVETLSTDVVAADPASQSANTVELIRLLEGLKGAKAGVTFDPTRGVTDVVGLDRALDAVVGAAPSAASRRESFRVLCADALWRRGLPAAGLCEVPDAVKKRASIERSAVVFVPGRGEATMTLAGVVETGVEGSPGAVLKGRLAEDASFRGDGGIEPPPMVGPVNVAEVEGSATTNWPAAGGAPYKGEWTTTIRHAGGLVVRTTITFTLVRP
jgi:hypothetical protein